MNALRFLILILMLSSLSENIHASHKVYFIHGYGGHGFELNKLKRAVNKSGFECEIFSYQSLRSEIDSVALELYFKIKKEGYDTISFVTHSMGGIVVRALHLHINQEKSFPFIYRTVMIAPPNSGSPVADSLKQYGLIRFLVGPNIHNLTTDSISGANKYPKPTGELGVIIGLKDKDKWYYTVPLPDENDGIVLSKSAIMGIEKDVVKVDASHIMLIFNKKVKQYVVRFLKEGKFTTS